MQPGQNCGQTDRQKDGQKDRRADTLIPISLRYTGDNNSRRTAPVYGIALGRNGMNSLNTYCDTAYVYTKQRKYLSTSKIP